MIVMKTNPLKSGCKKEKNFYGFKENISKKDFYIDFYKKFYEKKSYKLQHIDMFYGKVKYKRLA